MTVLTRILAAVAGITLSAAAYAETVTATPPAEAVIDAAADRNLRMTVPVTIDGKGPFPFVVDTGADRTVVSRELATLLNLEPGKSVTMHSMTRVETVDTVVVPRLEVVGGGSGGARDELHAPALSEYYLGAKGLLGVDSLKGRRVVMDFRKKTFTVTDSRFRDPQEPDTIVVTARSRFGQLVLVDSDIDGLPITVIVDSGAQNSIGNLALRRLLAKRQRGMEFYKTQLTDVTGGSMPAELALVDNIRIGGFTVNTVVVAFADAHPFKRFDLLNRPAMLLGMDTLKVFRRVSVDFAARKIRFLLPGEV